MDSNVLSLATEVLVNHGFNHKCTFPKDAPALKVYSVGFVLKFYCQIYL